MEQSWKCLGTYTARVATPPTCQPWGPLTELLLPEAFTTLALVFGLPLQARELMSLAQICEGATSLSEGAPDKGIYSMNIFGETTCILYSKMLYTVYLLIYVHAFV